MKWRDKYKLLPPQWESPVSLDTKSPDWQTAQREYERATQFWLHTRLAPLLGTVLVVAWVLLP